MQNRMAWVALSNISCQGVLLLSLVIGIGCLLFPQSDDPEV